MKIAVTGGTGFIGSHLVPALVREGHDVSVIASEMGGAPLPGSVRVVIGDVTTGEGLAGAFAGAELVVHLAARNHVLRETEADPLAAYRRVNVEGTRNVVRAALSAGARGIVHFSSVKAMGEESDAVLTEASGCRPTTPYGISKLEAESVLRSEAGSAGLSVAILRLPMAYGPGNRGNLPRLIRWAERGLPFPRLSPEPLRSTIYVGNAVSAALAATRKREAGVEVYLVRDRDDHSSAGIYSTVCGALGVAPRFLTIPPFVVRAAGALSADFRKVTGSFRVSGDKAARELGYVPAVSFEDGIAETVRWCLSHTR